MITLKNVSKSFGSKEVLKGFSHVFLPGVTVIHGSSGAGKTTLARIILGLEKPDSGNVEVEGRVSALFQEDRLIENLSLLNNLLLVSADMERISLLIGKAGLSGNENLRVSTLSGGMKRRVSLIRALLTEYDSLILDEPFTGLDDGSRKEAAKLILSEAEGKTLIAISHDSDDECLLNADSVLLLPNCR